jgi:ParB/RepB/Spo0J family partition protein
MSITALATAEPDDFAQHNTGVWPDTDQTGTVNGFPISHGLHDEQATPGQDLALPDDPEETDLIPVDLVLDGEVLDGELVDDEPNDDFERLIAQMPQLRVEYVDPAMLIDNPRNLRASTTDVEDLKASMQVVGILCPLVVVPVDGDDTQLMIMIGHRRKYAAIDLGFPRVPCVVASDDGAAKLIVAQLAENGHRLGLTATEEAEGYHQLTLLDWTPEKIAKVRHISAAKVKKSLTLRALPEAARAAADAGELTLDDAAVMAEFTDQPTALGRILKQATTWGFKHAVATERSKAAYSNAKDRVKAELILAGVKVTGKPKGWNYNDPAVEASRLVDADGERLNIAEVRTRPGFAAFIEKNGDSARAVVYCVNPAEHGYSLRQVVYSRPGVSEEERAAKERAEQEKAAHQEALKIAATVRTDFYKQTYTPTRVIKKLFPDALRATVLGADLSRHAVGNLYADLGGVADDALEAAKEDLLRRCLVAQWISHQEHNLRYAAEHIYYMDDDAAAAWLQQLVADGYTLSEAETKLLHDITPADPADEPAADEETEPGDEDHVIEADGDVEPEPELDAVAAQEFDHLVEVTGGFDEDGTEAMVDDIAGDEPLG